LWLEEDEPKPPREVLESDLLGDGEGETEREGDGEGDTLRDGVGDGDGEGENVRERDGDGDGDGLRPNSGVVGGEVREGEGERMIGGG
jgi:hypothetical protein